MFILGNKTNSIGNNNNLHLQSINLKVLFHFAQLGNKQH